MSVFGHFLDLFVIGHTSPVRLGGRFYFISICYLAVLNAKS